MAYPQIRSVEMYLIFFSGVVYPVEIINFGADQNGDFCNLYKKLCIKLVSIKELYYDARPTKSQGFSP